MIVELSSDSSTLCKVLFETSKPDRPIAFLKTMVLSASSVTLTSALPIQMTRKEKLHNLNVYVNEIT